MPARNHPACPLREPWPAHKSQRVREPPSCARVGPPGRGGELAGDLPVHGDGAVGGGEHGVQVQRGDLRDRGEQVAGGDHDPGQRGEVDRRAAAAAGEHRVARAASRAGRRPRRPDSGASANATSASASTQIPPSPTITTGPNDGSRNPPTTTSVPASWGCTSTASVAAEQLGRGGPRPPSASGSPSRTPPSSVRCSAAAILTTAGNAVARGGGLVRGAAHRAAGGRHPELGQQRGDPGRVAGGRHRAGVPAGLGAGGRTRSRATRVAAGQAGRPRGARRPVEHRQPGLGQHVGPRAGPARRHPADVHRHGDPVGAQRAHRRRAGPSPVASSMRRALQQHRAPRRRPRRSGPGCRPAPGTARRTGTRSA